MNPETIKQVLDSLEKNGATALMTANDILQKRVSELEAALWAVQRGKFVEWHKEERGGVRPQKMEKP